MIQAPYLKQVALVELREQVPSNLERYRSTETFQELTGDASLYFETDVQIDDSLLKTLLPPDKNLYDVENALTVFQALQQLTLFDARDERLWTYLCHTICMLYVKKRWPVPQDDEEAIKHVRAHFFASTNRAIERDNAISRLWWLAYLCSRVRALDINVALEVLLYRTDARAQIIEHPTMSQNADVFSALVEALEKSYMTDQSLFERKTNRRLISEINAIGGYKLLDVLTKEQLRTVVDTVVVRLP